MRNDAFVANQLFIGCNLQNTLINCTKNEIDEIDKMAYIFMELMQAWQMPNCLSNRRSLEAHCTRLLKVARLNKKALIYYFQLHA